MEKLAAREELEKRATQREQRLAPRRKIADTIENIGAFITVAGVLGAISLEARKQDELGAVAATASLLGIIFVQLGMRINRNVTIEDYSGLERDINELEMKKINQ